MVGKVGVEAAIMTGGERGKNEKHDLKILIAQLSRAEVAMALANSIMRTVKCAVSSSYWLIPFCA